MIPSDYIIRAYNSNDYKRLKTWKIEGSNDKQKWIPLDSRTNNSELKGEAHAHLFHISNSEHKDEPIKYLRIQQLEKNWDNNDYLLLNSIEFYGKII